MESGASQEVASLSNMFSLETDTGMGKTTGVDDRYYGTMDMVVEGGDAAEIQDHKGQIRISKGGRDADTTERLWQNVGWTIGCGTNRGTCSWTSMVSHPGGMDARFQLRRHRLAVSTERSKI